jgi:methionine-rich copper-binding protein CopC
MSHLSFRPSRTASSWLVRLALVPALAALVLASAAPAFAHDSVVGTVPAAGATVEVAPTSVVIHLEEPPGELGNSIAVTGPGGGSVTAGAAVVSGTDLTVALTTLTVDGPYKVAYRVVSDDGHVIGATYTWTLASGAPSSASASPSASPSTPSSPSTASWWLPAALLAVALAVLAAVVLRRRRPPADDV